MVDMTIVHICSYHLISSCNIILKRLPTLFTNLYQNACESRSQFRLPLFGVRKTSGTLLDLCTLSLGPRHLFGQGSFDFCSLYRTAIALEVSPLFLCRCWNLFHGLEIVDSIGPSGGFSALSGTIAPCEPDCADIL